MMRPIKDPIYEAKRFRIWQAIRAEEGKCTYSHVARVTGIPRRSVTLVCERHGMIPNFEDEARAADSDAGLKSRDLNYNKPVDTMILDQDNFSRIKWYSSED